MKTLLTIFFLTLILNCKAQTPKAIDSFLGIKFGSTIAEVKAALKLKGGVLDAESSKANILFYDNVSLAKRKVAFLYIRFVENKAYQCTFVFEPELKPQTIDFYNRLVSDIGSVYGTGKEIKKFKSPYEEGDGYEVQAIELGNAEYETFWGMADDQQPGAIYAEITAKLMVNLTYEDKKLSAIVATKNEEQKKAEF
jgi:hypothetical protein